MSRLFFTWPSQLLDQMNDLQGSLYICLCFCVNEPQWNKATNPHLVFTMSLCSHGESQRMLCVKKAYMCSHDDCVCVWIRPARPKTETDRTKHNNLKTGWQWVWHPVAHDSWAPVLVKSIWSWWEILGLMQVLQTTLQSANLKSNRTRGQLKSLRMVLVMEVPL